MQIVNIGEHNKDVRKFLETLEGKNINLLIGAGASMPYLKSLKLGDASKFTFEDVMHKSYSELHMDLKDYVSAYFIYKSLFNGTYKNIKNSIDTDCISILGKYNLLIEAIYKILQRNSIQQPRRVNIFSSNYDMFFECAFDNILLKNSNLYFNDGSYGFVNKIVSTQRFHMKLINVGVDSRYEYEMPMFNLIKLHGSLNWKLKDGNKIIIDNSNFMDDWKVDVSQLDIMEQFANSNDELDTYIENLTMLIGEEFKGHFEKLNELAIVRPTKRKFYDTVFEEHFFQSLRLLTQELERQQSVLIVFGFSFNDEHILSIIKRSLLNPNLLLYIICYDINESQRMSEIFKDNSNVLLCINKTSVGSGKGDFDFLITLLGGCV